MRRSEELLQVVRGLQVSNSFIDKLQKKLLEQGSLDDWLDLVNLWELETSHLYALGKIMVAEKNLEENAGVEIVLRPDQLN